MYVALMEHLKKHTKGRWIVALLRVCSLVVFAIAVTTLISHWVGFDHGSRWFHEEAGMAVNTAIAFLFVAVSLSAMAGWIHDQPDTTRRHRGSPRALNVRRVNTAR